MRQNYGNNKLMMNKTEARNTQGHTYNDILLKNKSVLHLVEKRLDALKIQRSLKFFLFAYSRHCQLGCADWG